MSKLAALLRRLFGSTPANPSGDAARNDDRQRIVETMLMGRSCCG